MFQLTVTFYNLRDLQAAAQALSALPVVAETAGTETAKLGTVIKKSVKTETATAASAPTAATPSSATTSAVASAPAPAPAAPKFDRDAAYAPVGAAINKLVTDNRRVEAVAILAKYGVKKGTDLKDDVLLVALDDLNAALAAAPVEEGLG